MSKNEWIYLLMLLPGFAFLIVFAYLPMGGIVIAFQKFIPAKGIFGSRWIGLENFRFLIEVPDVGQVFINTVLIACCKLILGLIVPIVFALLLNEAKNKYYKRTVQTLVYLPHFLSWVILGVAIKQMFSLNGIMNQLIELLTGKQIAFFESNFWFRLLLILSDCWKGFGFGAIIYLAAILNISPNLYEAAEIDGANKWQQVRHITLPGIMPTVVLLATLSLGGVLNAGFDQVYNLYNPLVYGGADILDTYVYRMGLVDAQYGISTAVGLLKSIISIFLISLSYWLAGKYANYRIF